MERSTIHLVLDSTGRNRINSPNPCDFNVSIGGVSNVNAAHDPIADATPYESSTTQAGSTTTVIALNAGASSIENFYIDSILEIAGEFRRIISYSFPNATVTSAFTVAPVAGTAYTVRDGIPIENLTLQAGSTTSQLFLNLSSSGNHQGSFIRMRDGVAAGEVSRITSYNTLTKAATIIPYLTSAPGIGDTYEILPVTRDNVVPISHLRHRNVEKPVPYRLKLMSASFPNVPLFIKGGGTIADLAEIGVEIITQNAESSAIIGNTLGNPSMILKCNDTNTDTPFIHLDSRMEPEIHFSPSHPIRIRLITLDGKTLRFAPDRLSPLPPNPSLQVRLVLAMERLHHPTHFTQAHIDVHRSVPAAHASNTHLRHMHGNQPGSRPFG